MLGQKSRLLGILIVVVIIAVYFGRPKKLGKLVKTKLGLVQGLLSNSRDGREFYEWLGIPFARPPVGDLRFASPKPAEKWDGILSATAYAARCAQHIHLLYGFVMGGEDCLYLNIYTPKLKDEQPLPVMVYFHGGTFKIGSGGAVFRPTYFMDEDVIVVTVNYRLSVLGFLATGDKTIRGNMGLKDQVQALKWVQEHIQSFGGDLGKVTIFGHSAGGASVHYLSLSPMANNLFHRAISLSGVATNPWAFMPPAKMLEKTKMIATSLGCPSGGSGSSQQLAACLRNASLKDLMDTAWKDANEDFTIQPHKFGFLPVPTIEAIDDEDTFLAQHPRDVISQGKAHRIPWMVGYTADEGLMCTIQFKNDKNTVLEFEENADACLKSVFAIESNLSESLGDKTQNIQDFYFPRSKSMSASTVEMTTDKKIQTYTKLFGDAFLKFDIRESIMYQRQFSPVYPYFYNNSGGPSLNEFYHSFFGTQVTRFFEAFILSLRLTAQNLFLGMDPPEDNEIGHGADLSFLFSFYPVIDIPQSSKHYAFSKNYVKLLVDFATITIDASKLTFRGVEFPATPKEGPLKFLHITGDTPEVLSEPGEERMKFLSSLGIRKYKSSYHT